MQRTITQWIRRRSLVATLAAVLALPLAGCEREGGVDNTSPGTSNTGTTGGTINDRTNDSGSDRDNANRPGANRPLNDTTGTSGTGTMNNDTGLNDNSSLNGLDAGGNATQPAGTTQPSGNL